jgi:hypothetical protein
LLRRHLVDMAAPGAAFDALDRAWGEWRGVLA